MNTDKENKMIEGWKTLKCTEWYLVVNSSKSTDRTEKMECPERDECEKIGE